VSSEIKGQIYTGFKEVALTDTEIACLYEFPNNNVHECLVNEYLIVKDSGGDVLDYFKWDGIRYCRVVQRYLDNQWMGKVKGKNPQQILAIDMLTDTNIGIKILTGRYGSGKDFLMASAALDMITKRGKYDKIVWIRNGYNVKNVSEIGFIPGSAFDKILPYVMPLADCIGSADGLDYLIKQEKVVVEHLGYIRGRSFSNSIIICSEAQNMTKELVQLLIGRVGEGSALFLNGDYKQTDSKIFDVNNGLIAAIERLKGHQKFGFVHLLKTERSDIAEMASLLDD
jgi:PhoH-like ATPase